MELQYKVAVLVGSLRKDSLNLRLANALVVLAPDTLNLEVVQIGDLPLYNPDLDDDRPPAPWMRFRDGIRDVDAILFVTPEYNRSIPASLKNALDVGSRPMGKSVWDGKPAAIATGSPGGIGGFGANHILRQSLVFLNVPAMQQPEAYIGGLGGLFDDEGKIAKPETKTFLTKFMKAYASWVARNVDR
jgi:chromate reductase